MAEDKKKEETVDLKEIEAEVKAEEKKATVETKEVKPKEKKEPTDEKKEEKPAEAKEEKKTEKPKDEKADKPKEEKKKKDKDEKKVDIVSENVYTIPLGKAHRTKPIYKRTSKAITFIIKYLQRHTKSDNVKIGEDLNRHLWAKGAKKPPRKVQIKAVKDSEGKVTATLLA
jgi:large subunit ribosomal protein L31e